MWAGDPGPEVERRGEGSVIRDEELRELFASGCREYLSCLAAGAGRLSRSQGDPVLLDEMLMAAHTLKGSARMVGEEELQWVAHAIEERLKGALSGGRPITPAAALRLGEVVAAMDPLLREAVTGEPAGIGSSALINRLAAPEEGE